MLNVQDHRLIYKGLEQEVRDAPRDKQFGCMLEAKWYYNTFLRKVDVLQRKLIQEMHGSPEEQAEILERFIGWSYEAQAYRVIPHHACESVSDADYVFLEWVVEAMDAPCQHFGTLRNFCRFYGRQEEGTVYLKFAEQVKALDVYDSPLVDDAAKPLTTRYK